MDKQLEIYFRASKLNSMTAEELQKHENDLFNAWQQTKTVYEYKNLMNNEKRE
jgi:hypothetical protein